MNQLSFDWFAGFFEGEGCIYIDQSSRTVRLDIVNTDHEVLLAIKELIGGNVTGPYTRQGRTPFWTWRMTKRESVQWLLQCLSPKLSTRRNKKISEAQEWFNNHPELVPGRKKPIATAPKDREIWVYTDSCEGLPAIESLCRWHPDAGFCVDEIRNVTHWKDLR